ncbi:unnamed protein product [Caenorhabditis bovis]|uniref:Acyl-coenzyme A oxidase n=1 Tax=Caenorhabditis bovis TaxID=2654633 RepID=A0A8S1EXA4_9PELO|nr:unnamed protein product [Caenorhabditis bovis]
MTSIDEYRRKASFDWKKLKIVLEGEDIIEAKNDIIRRMQADPVFQRNYDTLSREEYREVVHKQWKAIQSWNLFSDPYEDLTLTHALSEILEFYDQATSARFSLHLNVFGAAVKSMGTEVHADLIKKIDNNEVVGAFCLTEIGHGSNTAEVETTVTYENGELVFNSPTITSIKCWAGNLAHSATHAVVFGQLIVKGKNEGFHGFVIQIRDPLTFDTLPGITIGDMGSKPGAWQGVENGWMEFKNYRAPASALLNKGCQLTPDGSYVSSFKTVSEKKSVSLGTLSIGRISIIGKGMLGCATAATIAIRYSAARHQFGPTKGAENEVAVLEYPLQQYRLFPYLASAICLRIFNTRFYEHFTEYMMRVMQGEKSDELAEFSKEVHALSSGAKPVSTWLGVEALGEARKACGGHGFLSLSRLNKLRDDNDPSQTFEGENFMLLQQTSNVLLGKYNKGDRVVTPMNTMDLLNKTPKAFAGWSNCIISDVLSAYEYLIHYLLKVTNDEVEKLKKLNKNSFEIKNETQIHRAVPLTIAYTEHTIIKWCQEFVRNVEDIQLKDILRKVVQLFALFLVERHLATLYIGNYASNGQFGEQVREKLRLSVANLKDDSMALVDTIAPHDFILNSALGSSNGKVYENIIKEFRKHTNEKPRWLCDLVQTLQQNSMKSKL